VNQVNIFIGFDYRERAATNVLIDSLYINSKSPISVTPLITSQLKRQNLYWRDKDKNQSTDFSFTRFLVPYLMNYDGWAIFMDCDMLCRTDISELVDLHDDEYAVMCVKHNHFPNEKVKFQGEKQTSYPKKNWSSLMLFNCRKCKSLSLDYVNNASGLDLHRFHWLDGDHLIGSIDEKWNHLVEVNTDKKNLDNEKIKILHWTLGGPWFKDQRYSGERFAAEWFAARDISTKLWD